jgi:hypothetical protein
MALDSTQTILSVTGQTGVLVGNWFNVDCKDYHPIEVEILAGSGVTVKLQGRAYPGGQPVDLATFTATDGGVVAPYPQIRANITAATGATVKVTTGFPVRS